MYNINGCSSEMPFSLVPGTRVQQVSIEVEYSLRMRIDLVPRANLDIYTSEESKKSLFISPALLKRLFWKFRSTCLGRYHATQPSHTEHHIYQGSSVTGIRNCSEIILLYVRLFRQSVGLGFIVIDDNMTTHHTVAVAELLKIENIQLQCKYSNCTVRSPDLNPVAQIQKMFGRLLSAHDQTSRQKQFRTCNQRYKRNRTRYLNSSLTTTSSRCAAVANPA